MLPIVARAIGGQIADSFSPQSARPPHPVIHRVGRRVDRSVGRWPRSGVAKYPSARQILRRKAACLTIASIRPERLLWRAAVSPPDFISGSSESEEDGLSRILIWRTC